MVMAVADVLRGSSALTVSEDGFQVKRAAPLADMAEVSKAVDSRRWGSLTVMCYIFEAIENSMLMVRELWQWAAAGGHCFMPHFFRYRCGKLVVVGGCKWRVRGQVGIANWPCEHMHAHDKSVCCVPSSSFCVTSLAHRNFMQFQASSVQACMAGVHCRALAPLSLATLPACVTTRCFRSSFATCLTRCLCTTACMRVLSSWTHPSTNYKPCLFSWRPSMRPQPSNTFSPTPIPRPAVSTRAPSPWTPPWTTFRTFSAPWRPSTRCACGATPPARTSRGRCL